MRNKSKARIELDKDRDEIFSIFGFRCVKCGRPTNVIHEIIPISHGKSSLVIENRIPLCDFPTFNSCHDWAHRVGTRISIPILQQVRLDFLTRSQDGAFQKKEGEQANTFEL